MTYVIGQDNNAAGCILHCLGVEDRAVPLEQYAFKQGDLPILISSGGENHGDSLTLTDKLGKTVEVKVVFDRHADFNDEHDDFTPYCSHALIAYRKGNLRELSLLGIDEQDQVPRIQRVLSRAAVLPDTKLSYSADITEANKIKGKRLHISVDIDVIRDAGCVCLQWTGTTGPTLDELAAAVKGLAQRNQLVGFDIVGYCAGIIQPDSEGLKIYRTLLAQINPV